MKKDKTNRRARRSLLILIIAGLALAFAGIAAARYTMQKRQSGLVAAKDFYFTSNLLTDESEKAEYYVDPEKTISVELYNYADSLRITPGTIEYEVGVTGGSRTDSAGNQLIAGSAPGPSEAKTAELIITPDAGAASVTVTVTSSKPYKKVLAAVFNREKGNLASLDDASGNKAAVLTMTCADAGGKPIFITLPSDVIPDMTDDRVTDYSYESHICTFISPGYGVYSLVLLKSYPDTELAIEADNTFADAIKISSTGP